MSKDTGGYAFPIYPRSEGAKTSQIVDALGMTLRDYCAGQIAAAAFAERRARGDSHFDGVAYAAYAAADAMIAERLK